jgi:hypothetical protein
VKSAYLDENYGFKKNDFDEYSSRKSADKNDQRYSNRMDQQSNYVNIIFA